MTKLNLPALSVALAKLGVQNSLKANGIVVSTGKETADIWRTKSGDKIITALEDSQRQALKFLQQLSINGTSIVKWQTMSHKANEFLVTLKPQNK